jgi:hypothetical protein
MPFREERKAGQVKDTCLLCAMPVYEAETGTRYLGLWVHLSCYQRENEFSESTRIDASEASE